MTFYQLDLVDEDLDALESPTTQDVYTALRVYDDAVAVAAVGRRALEGGGGSASRSFLSTSLASGNVTITTSFDDLAFDFPADSSNGDDVTLSADGKTFTFVNDGIYSILTKFYAGVTLADQFYWQIAGTYADGTPLKVDANPAQVSVSLANDESVGLMMPIPAMWFTAGDSFTMQASVANHASNGFLTEGVVLVSRVV